MPNQYTGDGAPRTGLVVSMGVLPVAVGLRAEEIVYDKAQMFDHTGRPLTVTEMQALGNVRWVDDYVAPHDLRTTYEEAA